MCQMQLQICIIDMYIGLHTTPTLEAALTLSMSNVRTGQWLNWFHKASINKLGHFAHTLKQYALNTINNNTVAQ